MWKKIFISRMLKNSYKSIKQRKSNFLNGRKILTDTLSKNDEYVLKGCSTSPVIREMHIENTKNNHYTPTRMCKVKKT